MINYPYLKEQPTSRQTVEVFRGLNRNTRIGDGEFCEMENMTSDHFPVLAPREKRMRVGQLSSAAYFTGGLYVPEVGLFFTCNEQGEQGEDEYASLYLLTAAGEVDMISTSLSFGWKSLALMGTTLIIAPDMKWLDIKSQSPGLHSMGESWDITSGTVTISLCKADGTAYQGATVSAEPPANPGYLELWIDTSQIPHCLKQYNAPEEEWITIPTTYLKISGLGETQFADGDGVHISGLGDKKTSNIQLSDLNGCHVVHHMGHGEMVITGILDETWTQDCAVYPIRIERKVPKLSFVVEAGNRLWGCTRDVNEIYASKLGDFKNWNVFSGLSTDSWVGNVGSPGEFTGCINHGGYPVFYKENFKLKVWPSSTGAHQIISTPCHGVERGSESSLAQLDGTIFYKSSAGIFADDGSGPVEIGQALGCAMYKYAYGGTFGKKYYLSMEDNAGKRKMFVYDLYRQLWHQEDRGYSGGLIGGGAGLYAAFGNEIWDLTGRTGTPEEKVSWFVRTGDLVDSANRKYISRLTLRLSLEPGSKVEIYVCYDHGDQWQKLGTAYGRKLGSFSLPVRPRRCDHLQLELRGEGMAKVYSITKTFEEGSELG